MMKNYFLILAFYISPLFFISCNPLTKHNLVSQVQDVKNPSPVEENPKLNFKRNDVAFLYSNKLMNSSYVKLKSLVTADVIAKLTQKLKNQASNFILTGIKFAICHKNLNDNACHSQIRLILQTVLTTKNGNLSFTDDTLHLFYELPQNALLDYMTLLAKNNLHNFTWIHDSLNNDSDAVTFGNNLLQILKTSTLFKVTAMEGDNFSLWDYFKIFPTQTIESSQLFEVFSGPGINEKSLTEAKCLANGAKTCTEVDANIIIGKIKALQNAKVTHVDSVDCASCHGADSIKADIKNKIQNFENKITDPALLEYFINEIKNNSKYNVANVRQLGYFFDQATVTLRTISEIDEQLNFLKLINP